MQRELKTRQDGRSQKPGLGSPGVDGSGGFAGVIPKGSSQWATKKNEVFEMHLHVIPIITGAMLL